jgi:hypothetical protein
MVSDGKYSEHRDAPLRTIVRRLQKSLSALALRVRELEQLQPPGRSLQGILSRVQAATLSLASRLSQVEEELQQVRAKVQLAKAGRNTTPPPADAPDVYERDTLSTAEYDRPRLPSSDQKTLDAYDKAPPGTTQPFPKKSGRAAKVFVKPKKTGGE